MTQLTKVKGGGNGFSFDIYGSDRKDDGDKTRQSIDYRDAGSPP